MFALPALLLSATLLGGVVAASPSVKLGKATVVGTGDGVVSQFLGIPYAQPPVGDLRLQLPKAVTSYKGTLNATTFGNQCIQQSLALPDLPDNVPPAIPATLSALVSVEVQGPTQSEDCLNLNVIAPAGAKSTSKLPVVFWIHGGGFQVGSNAVEPGEVVVNRSIAIGEPIIFVATNYRLSAFGFLGGSEVKDAGLGNLGLHDQRLALEWVQSHIAAFGGDPAKVTIWGESAGSISVAAHMIASGGSTGGLFRAAWMESGSAFPSGDITKVQPTFDFITSQVNCTSASDKLACLRTVSTEDIRAAMDQTPTVISFEALNIPYWPHADGVFLKDHPQKLVQQGSVAKVPFVAGSNEDEGTLFSLSTLGLNSTDDFAGYLKGNYFPDASNGTIETLMSHYPEDPATGSPFDTGDDFEITTVYKRMAAFQGDLIFQAPRRFFLSERSAKQPAWSFFSQRNKIPGLGAIHSSELSVIFGGQDMTDYLVRFVTTLNPNGLGAYFWPNYLPNCTQLLTFLDGDTTLDIIMDDFRQNATDFLTQLSLEQPI
ncbi:carotenoid ester lipase precursor [Trametes versicolor FP-101664 SS1]|uniref:carotenoid ester lipase precursor n=1 Tax=Trametes versicolor (strain FP-101664) TaxID=717944 RepID=UPI0004622C12|nr:carotenoid ester lipase precursor [Trametes versicolor FP-101664 SS1]EIW58886.1 carotenoid ester lipase precursor [Trametes versicolor FP-101664 SS1]